MEQPKHPRGAHKVSSMIGALHLAALVGGLASLAGAAVVTRNGAPRLQSSFGCLDDLGQPVDWAFFYKMPISRDSRDELYRSGLAYAVITSRDLAAWSASGRAPKWTTPRLPLSHADSLLLRTVGQAMAPPALDPNLNTVFYSDQPPTSRRVSQSRAHAKGILAMDLAADRGFWMIHSIPLFPSPRGEQLNLPESARKWGQSFLCVSFRPSQSAASIVQHIANMKPAVYDAHLQESLLRALPVSQELLVGATRGERTLHHIPKLHSQMVSGDGVLFDLFSQSNKDNADMFAWLNQELHSDLFAETWRNGIGGKLSSSCPANQFHIYNVNQVHMDTSAGGEVTWKASQDHSKWALPVKPGVVCVSDINRVKSQFKRGGGSVCIHCPGFWELFKSVVIEYEPCALGGGSLEDPNNSQQDESSDEEPDYMDEDGDHEP